MLRARRTGIICILIATICILLTLIWRQHVIKRNNYLRAQIAHRRYFGDDSRTKDEMDALKFEKTCKSSINRVLFLKVHKAGSTTVMNMFLRYGESHKLNIALPVYTGEWYWNYLGYQKSIQIERITKIPGNETYHIICNHATYNKQKTDEILGKHHKNIAIIRDPIVGLLSTVTYYDYIWNEIRNYYGASKSKQELLSAFLMNPDVVLTGNSFLYNRMFLDFGLKTKEFSNQTIINEHLQSINKEFELVMILEYFDESLILMKNKLCWNFKDILYMPLNTQKENNSLILTEKNKLTLNRLNNADYQLYNFFKAKFMRQVKEAGEDFFRQLHHFKQIQKSIKDYCENCASKQFIGCPIHTVLQSSWHAEFTFTQEECKFMMTGELELLERLWKKYQKRYDNWLKTTNKV